MIFQNKVVELVFLPLQEMPHQMTTETSPNDPLVGLILVIISFLAILASFAIFFLYRNMKGQQRLEGYLRNNKILNKNPKKIDKLKIIRPSHWEILSLEERVVIDLLIQSGGNFLQKNVSGKTNFSKSTVTRILSRLEDQDIVYRSPAGRGYRIFLKELETL